MKAKEVFRGFENKWKRERERRKNLPTDQMHERDPLTRNKFEREREKEWFKRIADTTLGTRKGRSNLSIKCKNAKRNSRDGESRKMFRIFEVQFTAQIHLIISCAYNCALID